MKKAKKKIKKVKKKTVSQLKKILDKVFSIYIRKKYALIVGGMESVMCVSCSVVKPITEMQAGHYISRSHNSLRYSEDNVFVQCVGCNVFKHGNYPAYTAFLIRKFGEKYVLNLEKRGREIKQFTTKELEDLIEKYRSKSG